MRKLSAPVGRRDFIAVLVAGLTATTIGGCGGSGTPAEAYSYTWCVSDLGAEVWHAGQPVRVAWTAVRGKQGARPGPASVRLTVLLSGPFRSVAELKQAISGSPPSATRPGGRAPIAAAPAIRATTRSAAAPVSALTIPQDAPAGFYDLQFVVAAGTSRNWGSTIIRVA